MNMHSIHSILELDGKKEEFDGFNMFQSGNCNMLQFQTNKVTQTPITTYYYGNPLSHLTIANLLYPDENLKSFQYFWQKQL